MQRIKLSDTLEISRIVHGMWRLSEWNMSSSEILNFVEQSIELGVTTFDHADIYGNYTCEKLFGKIFSKKPALRKEIELITKCGIKLISDKFPDTKLNHYDTSYNHIIKSVNQSLKNLKTDYIDLLLIHRPDPLMNPTEVVKAFNQLFKEGKVLNFGVSNFNPAQFEMLNHHFDGKLVTNQLEISPYCLEHFTNNNIDFCLKEKVKPMAWSPLAGGMLMNPSDEKSKRIKVKLEQISKEIGLDRIDKLIYAWILKHPANIAPIIGSGKIERLKSATQAFEIKLTTEQWFEIFVASQGYPVP